ncbi:BlaI/MecI/CopY family transcriptional regulator [Kordiimonas aquimaris]|uniref:BlaI/MecI/CopY family transcriptional regulator n=1 Tax=Kordiimonas aquimaris TaxID=707591 RepID=UPI0021D04FAA|nr:BlaI/MecI/CopY family transcriptional regulator [Kordiimonas aquimaris]
MKHESQDTADSKQISVAESLLMEALWQKHPLTAEDITNKVAKVQGWSAGTVKSLLNRLLSKDAVSAVREGRKYFYSPVLQRADYVSAEGRGLLNRLFDGKVLSFVSHFSENEKLSENEIAELKRLVEALDDDK